LGLPARNLLFFLVPMVPADIYPASVVGSG